MHIILVRRTKPRSVVAPQMFRNEVLDTVPQNLTEEWFVKLPRRGIIRYVCMYIC